MIGVQSNMEFGDGGTVICWYRIIIVRRTRVDETSKVRKKEGKGNKERKIALPQSDVGPYQFYLEFL